MFREYEIEERIRRELTDAVKRLGVRFGDYGTQKVRLVEQNEVIELLRPKEPAFDPNHLQVWIAELQRYDPEGAVNCQFGSAHMQKEHDGGWVKHKDIVALKEKLEALLVAAYTSGFRDGKGRAT